MTFDPLDLRNLGESIARAIGESEPTSLGDLPRFPGAGIYAVYYSGDHHAYKRLVESNLNAVDPHPIYVGRAASRGSRKGIADPEKSTALRARLHQHARSVDAAENLRLEDFTARWLVLEDVWVNLGESVLIRRHSPVWNAILDGFGNHDPGKGRHAGSRSRWDVLHPGRPWADSLAQSNESPEDVASDVEEYLRQRLD